VFSMRYGLKYILFKRKSVFKVLIKYRITQQSSYRVNIMTRLHAGQFGIRGSVPSMDIDLFRGKWLTSSGDHLVRYAVVTRAILSKGLKRTANEADHSPPSSAGEQYVALTSSSPIRFHVTQPNTA
jgi:hypothetical protein